MMEITEPRGNNVPVQSPLIFQPVLPYGCPDQKTLFVVCRGDEKAIRELLAPTPFEYVEDRFIVSVTDSSNQTRGALLDASIIVPVRYGDLLGGHYLFEYESRDSAIAGGRELWGYPKKYAKMVVELEGDTLHGFAFRQGKTLIVLEVNLDEKLPEVEMPSITPHLQYRVFPAPDGPGSSLRQILLRDTSPDFVLKKKTFGAARVTLRGLPTDPLDKLQPVEVLGGGLIVGDFSATEKNGWARVVDTLENF
jgi:acetoacetate decarboxylase